MPLYLPPPPIDTTPPAVGQILMSIDGITYTAQTPLTAPQNGSAGWLVNDAGVLLVTG